MYLFNPSFSFLFLLLFFFFFLLATFPSFFLKKKKEELHIESIIKRTNQVDFFREQ